MLNQQSNRQQEVKHFEYKVLSQKDGWVLGKFNPGTLESILNAQASQGWRLITSMTADVPSMMGNKREEMVLILERQR